MTKFFSFILIILMTFMLSCGTCPNKERVVYKTKIIVPTLNCAKPENYEEFKEKLISTENVHSEGALYEIISRNVKMMERQILLWENYKNCVENILKKYEEENKKNE